MQAEQGPTGEKLQRVFLLEARLNEAKAFLLELIDDKKSDKKDDDTCSKCGGDHDDKDHDKKDDKDDKKPAFLKKESAFSEGYGEAIAKSTAKFGKGALDTAKKSAGAVNKAINTATGRKGMKEAVMNALMADGLVNNPVSAEIMVEHMSDEWFDQVVQNLD